MIFFCFHCGLVYEVAEKPEFSLPNPDYWSPECPEKSCDGNWFDQEPWSERRYKYFYPEGRPKESKGKIKKYRVLCVVPDGGPGGPRFEFIVNG